MEEADLRQLLEQVQDGTTSADDAVTRLRRLPFADLGFARVDHHRALRQGLAEVVYAPGKTATQCVDIVSELLAGGTGPVVVSRADSQQSSALLNAHPEGTLFQPTVATQTLVWRTAATRPEKVVVATAGTSDLPVADECSATLAAHGIVATRITDVGVAGLHRLLAETHQLDDAQFVVVVAGMEGALASVMGGLTAAPIVAVPTSVGYGSSFEGVTALLAMLSSCASGISVVGIDNGFGAAMTVLRQLNMRALSGAREALTNSTTGSDTP